MPQTQHDAVSPSARQKRSFDEMKQQDATELPAYLRYMTDKAETSAMAFTQKIPSLRNDKLQFNERMLVADVMQRVNCFSGLNLAPVVARNSCPSPQETEASRRAIQLMRHGHSTDPRFPGVRFVTTKSGGISDFFRIGGVAKKSSSRSGTSSSHTIDFDKLGSEEPLGELSIDKAALAFDLESMSARGMHQPPTFTLDNPDQSMLGTSSCGSSGRSNKAFELLPYHKDTSVRCCEETFRHAWLKNNDYTAIGYDSHHTLNNNKSTTTCLTNNESTSAWLANDETETCLMQSSKEFVDTVLDERYAVPKRLTLSVLASLADMSMLSLVVVLNTLEEVRSTANFLRMHVRAKTRSSQVCEFTVGAFSDPGYWNPCISLQQREKHRIHTEEFGRQVLEDLQNTIKSGGIVVCLRRADVLTNFNDAMASIKANKSDVPGATICYTADIKNFNKNLSLLLVMRKLADESQKDLHRRVNANNVQPLVTPKSITKSKSSINKRKPPGRKFTKASHAPPDKSVKEIPTTVEPAATAETTWPSWDYTDNTMFSSLKERTIWWRPRVRYSPPEARLGVEDIIRAQEEVKSSFEWCEWYKQILMKERARLVDIKIPNCVGIMLAIESKDDDDDATKACVDALSGICDPRGVMIHPHCTVLLSHPPLCISTAM